MTADLIDRLRKLAAGLKAEAAEKRRPRNDNTPKRAKQATSARIDADNADRAAAGLLALADAGRVPEGLADQRITKANALTWTRTHLDCSGGYYSLRDTGEYCDKTPAAAAFRGMYLRAADPFHVAEGKRVAAIAEAESRVRFLSIPGFFPTPPALVEKLVGAAELFRGCRVLEPSAGRGDLADYLRDVALADVTVCEINATLRDILSLKGYKPHCDFEEFTPAEPFDRIVMNPPFEGGTDITHVRRAFDMLKPGGRLVSVMSAGPFHRSDWQATQFRQWLEEAGGVYEFNDADAFAAGPVRTGTRTVTCVIDRPEGEPLPPPSAGCLF